MAPQRSTRPSQHLKDDFSNDLKILALVLASAAVCMVFMLLAGASAHAAAGAWL